MKNINFIFLRSPVTASEKFQDSEREKFLEKLNEKDDFLFTEKGEKIFFIETGGTEEKFRQIYKDFKEPFLIVATNANNSLPAALEISTFLKNNGKKFKLIHGTPEEVKKKLKTEKIKVLTEKSLSFTGNLVLKGKRFGVVGKPSDWLIASEVDYKNVEQKLGAKLVDISIKKLIDFVNKDKSKIDTKKFDKYLNEKIDKKTLEKALKIYAGLKQLIDVEKLDGITVRCFDLLGTLKNTSCLALAMLNEEGYIATCEGDIPAMLTMAIVRKMFDQSSFQINPSYVNVEKKCAYFAHCTLPLDMCKNFGFDTHFESGIGIGIKGELDKTKITVFKINKDLTQCEIFVGKIAENLKKENLCRTQIKVKFSEDISSLLSSPNGNHLIVFYGDHKKELLSKLSH